MIIKTYDAETLQEKETISKLTSVIFTRRFYKAGSFEIETTSGAFKVNDIIAYKYKNEIRSGIVLKTVETNTGYSVTGYDLKGVYGFRYITNPTEYSGTPISIVNAIATEFLATGDRKLPGIIIAENATEDAEISFTPDAAFLDKVFETFGASNEVGTSLEFDLNNIVFTTLKGEDKSSRIKFCRNNRAIKSYEYTNDLFNTFNVGYSVDDDGNETITGTAAGFLRRECYKDKSISEYLAEKAAIETLRAEANEKYVYGIDYNLGDYVTVATKDVEAVKQITEVKEVYEKSQITVLPVFGTEKENPLKKILRGEQ